MADPDAIVTPHCKRIDPARMRVLMRACTGVRQERRTSGTLAESVRVHGGQGQTVASTHPGFVRGEHFHRRKIERFQVLSGRAVIRLRRVLTDEVIDFEINGDEPSAVDIPTMWAHSIKNVGTEELVTQFCTHEIFNPEAPDTYPEPVFPPSAVSRAPHDGQ